MKGNTCVFYSDKEIVDTAKKYISENNEEVAEPILYFLSELLGVSVDQLLEWCLK